MRYFICLLILVFAFNLNAQLPSPSLNKSGFCFNRVDSVAKNYLNFQLSNVLKSVTGYFNVGSEKDVLILSNDSIYVLLNNDGTGKFNSVPPENISANFSFSETITDFCVSDFNNDGRSDIAFIVGAFLNRVEVYENTSSGSIPTFSLVNTIFPETNYEFKQIESGDVDGDLLNDIVVTQYDFPTFMSTFNYDYSIICLKNAASFVFNVKNPVPIFISNFVSNPYFKLADINNNGKLDVVVSDNILSDTLEIYNSLPATYSSTTIFDPSPTKCIGNFGFFNKFIIDDITNDGKKDIILLKHNPGDNDTLLIIKGDGTVTFTNTVIKYVINDLYINNQSIDIFSNDFNQDGLKDVVLIGDDSIRVISGLSSTPYLSPDINYIALSSINLPTIHHFLIDDFNNDSYKDIFVYDSYFVPIYRPRIILNQSYTSSITVSKSTPYCVGDQIILNNVILPTSASVTSVLWNGVSSGSATTQYTVNTSSTSSTSYSSSVTYSIFTGNTCKVSSSNSVSITVNPKPTLTLSLVSASVCPGTSFTLTAQGSETTALWQPGSLSGFNTVVSPAATTIYSITQTNAAGCSETGTVIIGVLKTPTVNIVPNGPVQACEGQSVKLKAINASGSAFNSYQWYSSSSGALSNNDSVLVLTPQNTSTITVKVYDYSLSNCYGKDSVQVIILPKPTLNASVNPQKVCPGKPTTITVTGAQSYTWQPVHLGNGNQVVVRPVSYFKTYTVSATDAYGCETTDTITVDVEKKCGLTVYNLVSPNSDGSNDYFEIDGISDFKHTVSIYNRWGQKLFESADYKNNWDGSSESNGVHVPAGTYFYIIELPEQKEIFKGWIELIKN